MMNINNYRICKQLVIIFKGEIKCSSSIQLMTIIDMLTREIITADHKNYFYIIYDNNNDSNNREEASNDENIDKLQLTN